MAELTDGNPPKTATQTIQQQTEEGGVFQNLKQTTSLQRQAQSYSPRGEVQSNPETDGVFAGVVNTTLRPKSREEITGMIQKGLEGNMISDPNVSVADPTPLEGNSNWYLQDWWNDLQYTINDIQASSDRGKQLEYDRELVNIQQQKNQILNDPYLSEDERAKALQELTDRSNRVMFNPDYQEARQDQSENLAERDQYSLSDIYRAKKNHYSSEESSNIFNYLAYESAGDLGGSYSDLSTMAKAFATTEGVLALGNLALATLATGASEGVATPWLIQAATWTAAIGAGVYFTMQGRENETYAEMSEAYDERVQSDLAKYIGTLPVGQAPDENEILNIKAKAFEGMDQFKKQQMLLSAPDMLQTALLSLPWTRAFKLGKLGGLGGRTMLRTGEGLLASVTEGMEETSQFQMKENFIAGLYKDNYTTQDVWDDYLKTTKNSAMYALTGTTDEGYENDPEFRNAYRSGAILGGGMHQASGAVQTYKDYKFKKILEKDAEKIGKMDIETLKSVSRADQLASYIEKDGSTKMYQNVLSNMKGQQGTDAETIDYEIKRAQDADRTFSKVDKALGATAKDRDKMEVFKQLQVTRDNYELFKNEYSTAQQKSNDILTNITENPTVVNPYITEKIARKEAVDSHIAELKSLIENSGLKSETNDKQLNRLEKESATLDREIDKDIESHKELEGGKASRKAFSTPFDDELVSSFKNQYAIKSRLEFLDDMLREMNTPAGLKAAHSKLTNIRRTNAQQERARKAEAKKEGNPARADQPLPAEDIKDTVPTDIPTNFIVESQGDTDFGYKFDGDKNKWYEYDTRGYEKEVTTKDGLTPEQIVANAFFDTNQNKKHQSKADNKTAFMQSVDEFNTMDQSALHKSIDQTAIDKAESRDLQAEKNYDVSLKDMGDTTLHDRIQEEKANKMYEDGNPTESQVANAATEFILTYPNGEKVQVTPTATTPIEKTTVSQVRKANDEKVQKQGKRSAEVIDRGAVITSVQMINSDNKNAEGIDIYPEDNPTVKYQNEFDFLPLIESGKITSGSKVLLEINPNYNNGKIEKRSDGSWNGGIYVFAVDEKGEKLSKKPITQLRATFSKQWQNATSSIAETNKIFEYFQKNGGTLTLTVSQKLPGNLVTVRDLKGEEQLSNINTIQEKSPWLFYKKKGDREVKLRYAISTDNNLLETNDNEINNDFNGTEATGKIIKKATPGSTFLLVRDGNGNPLAAKVINRSLQKSIIKRCIDNLRALPVEERQQYLKDVVSKVMYLDSNPQTGEAFNISLEGTLAFYKNFADDTKNSYKVTEEVFTEEMSKTPYRTAKELVNEKGTEFIKGLKGEGYSVKLDPIFQINGQTYNLESYNDYLSKVATWTNIKSDFPLHGTQIYLTPVEVKEAQQETKKEIKSTELNKEPQNVPQGFIPISQTEMLEHLGVDMKELLGEVNSGINIPAEQQETEQPTNASLSADLKNEIQEPKEIKPEQKKSFKKRGTGDSFNPEGTGEAKFKVATSSEYKIWNKDQELTWFAENLPNVPVEIRDNLMNVHMQGGLNAWGLFKNSVVYMAENAEQGTGFHEAFHAVFNLFLNEKQKEKLLRETEISDNAKAEEFLAEQFRKYVLTEEDFAPKTGTIENFFKQIYYWIKDKLGLLKTEELFKYINSGGYSRRTLPSTRNNETKFKLAPGLTPEEQRHRVNTIVFDFFDILKQEQGVENIYKLNADLAITEKTVRAAFDKIYNWYVEKYESLEEGALKNKTELILENFDLLVEQAKQNIRSFGYKVNATYSTELENPEQENMEVTTPEKIYDRPAFEESVKNSLSREMKIFLSTIPSEHTDEYGRISYVPFEEVYSVLSQRLTNVSSVEEMMSRISYIADNNPAINYVKEKLMSSELQEQDGKRFNNFKAKFFATFYLNYGNFITISKNRFDVVDKRDPQNSYVDSRTYYTVMDSNSLSQSKSIKTQWRNDIVAVQGTKIPGLIQEYNQALNQKKDVKVFAEKTSTLLSKLGIKVDSAAIVESVTIDNPTTVHNLFYSTKQGIYKLLEAAQNGKRLLSTTSEEEETSGVNEIGEEKTITSLATIQSMHQSNPTGDAFRRSSGNTVHPISMHNAITEKIDKLKDIKEVERLRSLPGFQNNFILSQLLNAGERERLNFAYYGEEYDRDSKEGTEFNETVEVQFNRDKINAFLNNGKNTGWFAIPVLGDKSTYGFVRLSKSTGEESNRKEAYPRPFTSIERNGINERVIDLFERLAKDEFDRIHREINIIDSIPLKDQIKNYHFAKVAGDKKGKAFEFVNFPFLNTSVDRLDLINTDAEVFWGTIKEGVRSQLHSYLLSEIDKEFAYFESIGMLKKNEHGVYVHALDRKSPYFVNNLNLDAKALKEYGEPKSSIYNAVAHFITSSLAFNIEFSNLTVGEQALYKNKEDASKRMSSSGTPGTKLHTGDGGANPTFTLAVLKDNEVNREELAKAYGVFFESMGITKGSEQYKRIVDAYSKVNQTDAQGFISLNRYRDILIGQGQWNDAYQKEYENLKAGKPTKDNIIMQPIKGIYAGTRFDGVRETFDLVKYSSFPLIPAYTDQFPTLKAMREKMDKDGIDEVVFDSAYKVGLRYAADSIENLSAITLPNSNWRIPQVVPVKQQKEANMGSQLRKLIFSNILSGTNFNVNGHTVSGDQIKSIGQALLNRMLELSYDKVYKTLDSKQKLADLIKEQIGERDLTEMYEETTMLDDKGEFMMPVSFPLISRKVENILNSFIRKRITRQKMPGLQAVQVSSFGINRSEMSTDTDLKDITFSKRGDAWVVEPAEVLLSPEYFIKTLKASGKDYSVLFDETGNFNEALVPEELRKVVIYRIPTQGKNSMLPVRIKGFLPKESGSSIVVPATITKIAGSDFDIDKVFVEMHNINFTEGKFEKVKYNLEEKNIKEKLEKRQIQTALVDIHYSILTNPATALEMLTPLDGTTIDTMKEKVVEVYKESGSSAWGSNRYQSDTAMKNQAGKNLVGVFALHTTFHAIAQEINLKLVTPIQFKGEEPVDRMDLIKNLENESLISDNFSEFLNAAVDNAKDPKLGPINVNEFTAGVAALLTHLGYFETGMALLNQPIIREYTQAYFRNSIGNSRTKAASLAKEEIGKETTLFDEPSVDSLKQLNLTSLMKTMESGADKETVLDAFLYLQSVSDSLTSMITGLNADTTGVASTTQGSIIKDERFEKEVMNNKFFLFDQEALRNHSVHTYQKKGITEPTEKLSEYFIWTTPAMKKVKGYAEDIVGRTLNENELTSLQYNLYSFLFTGNTHIGQIQNEDGTYISLREKKKVLFKSGDKSFASRIEKFRSLEKSWEKHGYKPSSFFKNLVVRKDMDGIDVVEFNNSSADARSKLNKDTMTFEIESLYNGSSLPVEATEQERKAVKGLMKDLVPYAFLTGGFNKSVYSFIDYIPLAIWKGEYDVVGDHNTMTTRLKSEDAIPTETLELFLQQYFQNNTDSSLLRTERFSKSVKAGDSTYYSVKSQSKFLRDWKGNVYYATQLAENPTEESKYVMLPVLGRPHRLQEYDLISGGIQSTDFPVHKKEFKVGEPIFTPTTKTQEQKESQEEIESIDESITKIEMMQKIFNENGVNVDVQIDSDIKANAQIEYSNGKPVIKLRRAFKDTVFHEFGHLYIDLLGEDHTLVKKGITELKDTKLYNEVKKRYPGLSKEELDNEVLATAIGIQGGMIYDSKTKADWWDRFVGMLLDAVGRIFPSLKRNTARELANQMLSGRLEELKLQNIIKANKIQKQVADMEEATPEEKEEVTRINELSDKMIDTFVKKAAIFAHKKGAGAYSDTMKSLIERMKTLDAKKSVLLFSIKAYREINLAKEKIDKIVASGNYSVKDLYQFKDYVTAYKILDEIPGMLREEGIEISKHAMQKLNDARSKRDDIIQTYYEFLPKIVSKELAQHSSKYNQKQIEGFLKKINGDISYVEAMADYMGDSKDPVLALLAKMTDEELRDVREKHLEFRKDFALKVKDLEKAQKSEGKSVGKDTELYDFMLEKEDGKLTGHYVTKHRSKYWEEKRRAFKEIKDSITSEMSETEISNKFKEWHRQNSIWSLSQQRYIPNDKWLNPQFTEISSLPETQKEFYNWFVSKYQEMQELIPEKHRMGTKLPSVRKGTTQRVQQAGSFKEAGSIVGESLTDELIYRPDDMERGILTTESGNPLDTVPVYYTRKDLPVEEQVFNVEELLNRFSYMAMEFEAKNDMLDVMEGARELVKNREIVQLDTQGGKILNALKGLINKEYSTQDRSSNAAKQLDHFIQMFIYGQRERNEGSVKVFGKNVDIQKATNLLNKYTSFQGLAFNWLSGLNNVSFGTVMNLGEAFAGEQYTVKDWAWAQWEYDKNLAGITADIYRKEKENKISLFAEKFDIYGDYFRTMNNPRNTGLKKATDMVGSSFYMFNSLGEHMLQSKVMLSILKHTKVFDKDGNKVDGIETAYDAFEVVNGKLKLKNSNVYIDTNTIGRKIDTIMRRMHGNYNSNTAIAMQQYALGKLALQFRKWLRPGFQRRWESTRYNEFLEKETRGAYKDFLQVQWGLTKDLARLRFTAVATQWEQLSERERANYMRTITEIGFFLTTMALTSLLMGGDDDDEEPDSLIGLQSLYLLKRLQTEMQSYVNPKATWDILRTPAASMSSIESMLDLLDQAVFDPTEKYKSGKRKGTLKVVRKFEKAVPLYGSFMKQYEKMTDEDAMKEQLKFFDLK